ncbi:hypothetical protein D9619_012129 [Psilocybe cf. subviscida]|uniref:Uncharacterized protein n=1 Tax=Psilocybe cf. subviscida TaxID=2480587 RepID=A0A8H5B9E8_9AGAR|nr:hypothetical protein D9619_012129 [Psilocybe cf. subviscida]
MDSTLDQLLDDVPTPPLMPGYFYLTCFNPQPGSKTSDSDLYATIQDEIGLPVKAEAFNVASYGVLTLNDPTGVPQGPLITTLPPDNGPTSDEIMYWIINPIKVAGLTPSCYTIQSATTNSGDTEYYVGVQDGELYIQSFPAGDQTAKPYWQLEALGQNKNTKHRTVKEYGDRLGSGQNMYLGDML